MSLFKFTFQKKSTYKQYFADICKSCWSWNEHRESKSWFGIRDIIWNWHVSGRAEEIVYEGDWRFGTRADVLVLETLFAYDVNAWHACTCVPVYKSAVAFSSPLEHMPFRCSNLSNLFFAGSLNCRLVLPFLTFSYLLVLLGNLIAGVSRSAAKNAHTSTVGQDTRWTNQCDLTRQSSEWWGAKCDWG